MKSTLAVMMVVGVTVMWTLLTLATASVCQKEDKYVPIVKDKRISLTSIPVNDNEMMEFQVEFYAGKSLLYNPLHFFINIDNIKNAIFYVSIDGIGSNLIVHCLHDGGIKLFVSTSIMTPRSLMFQVKSGLLKVMETTTGNNNNNNNTLDCNIPNLSHPSEIMLVFGCAKGARTDCGDIKICWKAITTNEGGDKREDRCLFGEWLVLVTGGVGFLLVILVTVISYWALTRLNTNAITRLNTTANTRLNTNANTRLNTIANTRL